MRIVRINPECPVCHSKQTGRYIFGVSGYQIKRHLINGERVQYTGEYSQKPYYCTKCRAEFYGHPRYKIMTRKEFRKYLKTYGFVKTRDAARVEPKKKKFDKKKFIKGLRLAITLISGVDIRDKSDKKKEEQ